VSDDTVAAYRERIDAAVAAGDLGTAAMGCEDLAYDLLDSGSTEAGISALREAVAHLRTLGPDHGWTAGFIEGTTVRVYGRLATLLAPSPEALPIAEELVRAITSGRAHPMDTAEALALCARVATACGTLDEARTAARRAVRQAESVCFHELSRQAEQGLADRLRAAGRTAEADQWAARAAHRLDDHVPGHTHLWDTRFTDDGRIVPAPLHERHGGPDYDAFPGHQPGAAFTN